MDVIRRKLSNVYVCVFIFYMMLLTNNIAALLCFTMYMYISMVGSFYTVGLF